MNKFLKEENQKSLKNSEDLKKILKSNEDLKKRISLIEKKYKASSKMVDK